MSTATIPDPRSTTAPRKTRRVNWEKYGWIYMRASGLVLIVLIFGHLFVNLFVGQGIHAIDFAFVAGKWANPFWIVWDTLMLWLALIHGANGMRTLINDYARGSIRKVLLGAILTSTIVLLLLGTLVIYTFNPCIDPQTAHLLPTVCHA